MRLRRSDILTLFTWLSPDFILPLAESFGNLIPGRTQGEARVIGAGEAYYQIRSQIRSYANYVRKREEISSKDLGLASALRSMGYVGNYKPVRGIQPNAWRTISQTIWSGASGSIPGGVRLQTGNASQKQVDLAVLQAVSYMLDELPGINLSFLQGHLWKRQDRNVLVNIQLRDGVRSISLKPDENSSKLGNQVSKAIKSAIRASNSDLAPLGWDLLDSWAKAGFIASPGGVMVASVPVIEGQSALCSHVNGIGIAVTICKIVNREVYIGINLDHKMYDGQDAVRIQHYILEEVPKLIARRSYEDIDNRGD